MNGPFSGRFKRGGSRWPVQVQGGRAPNTNQPEADRVLNVPCLNHIAYRTRVARAPIIAVCFKVCGRSAHTLTR